MPEPHAPRTKFDTLFADPRHYRGDLRLMRTAIRRGWLSDAPQADRDALVARFRQAATDREKSDPGARNVRAILAECWAMIEMDRANLESKAGALRYLWAGKWTGRTTGRPRERWQVSDYTNRIDANDVRRRAKADGTDLRNLRAIDVRSVNEPNEPGQRIPLAVSPDPRYGWRVWLLCPLCGKRRTHLYPSGHKIACRVCAGITYGVETGV